MTTETITSTTPLDPRVTAVLTGLTARPLYELYRGMNCLRSKDLDKIEEDIREEAKLNMAWRLFLDYYLSKNGHLELELEELLKNKDEKDDDELELCEEALMTVRNAKALILYNLLSQLSPGLASIIFGELCANAGIMAAAGICLQINQPPPEFDLFQNNKIGFFKDLLELINHQAQADQEDEDGGMRM